MKEIPQNSSGLIIKGLQFYIDLDAEIYPAIFSGGKLLKPGNITYLREWYYDGTVHHISPPDYSRMVCWSTDTVKSIFTLSTEGLTENRYFKFPLHFVDNSSPRLMYGYSLLINQFALSEAAYSYWDQLRINNSEIGGLYHKQPLSIARDLHNNANPDQKILGFFGVTSVKSRRIFVNPIDDIDVHQINYCRPETLKWGAFVQSIHQTTTLFSF